MIKVKDYFDPAVFHIMSNAPLVGAAIIIEKPDELIPVDEEVLADILRGRGDYAEYFVVYVELFDGNEYIDDGIDDDYICTLLVGVAPTEEIGHAYRKRVHDIVDKTPTSPLDNLVVFPGGAVT